MSKRISHSTWLKPTLWEQTKRWLRRGRNGVEWKRKKLRNRKSFLNSLWKWYEMGVPYFVRLPLFLLSSYISRVHSFTHDVSSHCYRGIYDLPCIRQKENVSRDDQMSSIICVQIWVSFHAIFEVFLRKITFFIIFKIIFGISTFFLLTH